MIRRVAVLGMLLTACVHAPPRDVALFDEGAAPDSLGELVYEGSVFRELEDERPLYRYERRVRDLADGVQSTHVTYQDSVPVVLHQAVHTPDYRLLHFRELHAQAGRRGQVSVSPEGVATFASAVGTTRCSRVERVDDPLHVGPTVFGHVLEHWESLVRGETHRVRFVVLERCRSFRFELRNVVGPEGVVRFEMRPASPVIALGVAPILMDFSPEREVLRYQGRVPPLDLTRGRARVLNATVTYRRVRETYR